MTESEIPANLREYNIWRRGDSLMPQPDPRIIGETIDAAIALIESQADQIADLKQRLSVKTGLHGKD